jgi:hypothetical protein
MKSYQKLDRILAAQGPSTVLIFLAVFLGIFVAAFGFLFYGISGLSFSDALYQAGSGMTTLGITCDAGTLGIARGLHRRIHGKHGDFGFHRLFAYTLLRLRHEGDPDERTRPALGEPAWGPEFLVRLKLINGSLGGASTESLITWMCSLRVTHYIYSILNHFRSPIPTRHWVNTLLSVLDAAAIRLAVLDEEPDLKLVRLIAEGADTFHMLRLSELARTSARLDGQGISTWRIESEILQHKAKPGEVVAEPGITRAEWDWAMDFLKDNGIPLKNDSEASWRTFCKLRSHYYEPAYFLADTLFTAYAPWTGTRSLTASHPHETVWPQLAKQRRETSGL